MSLLALLGNYAAGTLADGPEVQTEFQQLIDVLNETRTDKHLSVRFSGAEGVLILDQLGAGPIQQWRGSGNEKARLTNAGELRLGVPSAATGKLTLSASGSANNPSIQSGDTPASNVLYKWPADDPAATEVLKITSFAAGVAVLEWAQALTIQEEGTPLTQRPTLNFIGSGITAADNAGASKTDISIHAQLNSLADIAANGFLARTAANTITPRTLQQTANQVLISNPTGAAGDPVFSLPQNIHTGASPTFAAETITGLASVGNLQVSNEDIIKRFTSFSVASVDIGSLGAGVESTFDITVGGVEPGDFIWAEMPSSWLPIAVVHIIIPASSTIRVTVSNFGAAPFDPPAATWRFWFIDLT